MNSKLKNSEIDKIYKSYLRASEYQNYSQLDMYKRNPEYTRTILDKLRVNYNPINILVTGSKGKGSVSKMVSDILQIYFEKVGLFTSPHIVRFNERIQINNNEISDEKLIEKISIVDKIVDSLDIPNDRYISPIGILTAIAMLYFYENNCSVNVFECGKGAKFDDVNILDRDYSIINTIFNEHTRELGGSIEAIAEDKSTIIKKGQICAYSAKQSETVMRIIRERAISENVELKTYGIDFSAENISLSTNGTSFDVVTKLNRYDNIKIPLLGKHQAENVALAFQLCEDIVGALDIEKVSQIMYGLNWPGRLEIISHNPVIVLDACINRTSAISALEIIKLIDAEKIATIVGVPSDKDYKGIVEEMKIISDVIILTESSNTHYKFSSEQISDFSNYNNISYIKDLEEAVITAKNYVGVNGMVCILGTTSLITDVKKMKL